MSGKATVISTSPSIELATSKPNQEEEIAALAAFLMQAVNYTQEMAKATAVIRITKKHETATLSLELSTLSTLLTFYINARVTESPCSTHEIKTHLNRITPNFVHFFQDPHQNKRDTTKINEKIKTTLNKTAHDALYSSGDTDCVHAAEALLGLASPMTLFFNKALQTLGYAYPFPSCANNR